MKFETGIPIGEGAAGRVYKAWDPSLDRPVALKLLRRDDPESVARMMHEARVQARVRHPNVCQVYEVGETDDGRPYIAMQYIEGETLERAAAELTLEARIRLLIPVVEAVHAAHVAGLVHRDLKPGNVLVETDPDGGLRPWVLDFGIARETAVGSLTLTGQLIGTPAYMSPEQARGETRSLDRRSDVFSLGAILYELVTGARPFEAPSEIDTLIRVLYHDPQPPRRLVPGLPPSLEVIVLHCLDKDPGRRYPSARALAEDLERFLRGDPIEARPPSTLERLRRGLARRPVVVALTAATLLSLVAAAVVTLRADLVARDQARLAARFEQRLDGMESALDIAHRLPLHDIRPEHAKVRDAMDRLRAEIRDAGPAAAGPGRYALGRAHLLLGEHQRARELLEAAWSSGYRDPEVALALGRALGALYSERLASAGQLDEPALRAEVRRRAERELRDRAVEVLSTAEPADLGLTGAERLWVEGLLELYAGDLDAAERIGGQVAETFPWYPDGHVLIGDALLQRSAALRIAGELGAAESALERAHAALDRAVSSAPSDPALHLRRCALWNESIQLRLDRGALPDPAYPAALDACEDALTADGDLTQAHDQIAEASWLMAVSLTERGLDPEPALERAEAGIERSLASNPSNALATTLRGHAEMTRAQRAIDLGDSPAYDRHAQRALAAYRAAAELMPGDGSLLYQLGSALTRHGQQLSYVARDPMPAWEEAAAVFARAGREPGELGSRIQRGICRLDTEIGYYRFQRGDDPGASFDQAIAACRRALKASPGYLVALNDLGMALWSRAELEVAYERDPTRSFEQAIDTFGRVLEADPDRSGTVVNQSHVLAVYALWQQSLGRDPTTTVERAEALLERYREIYPVDHALVRAKTELVRALEIAERGGEPRGPGDDPFAAALDASRRGVELDPTHTVLAAFHVRVQRERAEWLEARLGRTGSRSSGGRLAGALDAALEASDALLERDPENAAVRAERALLLAVAGRTGAAGEGPAAMQEARLEAARALALRPDFRDELGALAGAAGG